MGLTLRPKKGAMPHQFGDDTTLGPVKSPVHPLSCVDGAEEALAPQIDELRSERKEKLERLEQQLDSELDIARNTHQPVPQPEGRRGHIDVYHATIESPVSSRIGEGVPVPGIE